MLFKNLKKLRLWYGDGGGEEWTDVDFNTDLIITSFHQDTNVVLSENYKQIIFNSTNEHAFGECHIAPTSSAPLWWFNPIFKQQWEYDTK